MKNTFILKLLATFVLFSFVLFKLDISELFDLFANSDIFLILTCLIFIPLLYSIRALKWNALLRSVGIKYNFFTVFRVLLIGTFYGLITPGKSGEILRAYYLDSEKSIIIPTIIWDKIIDIFVLAILTILSIQFLFFDIDLYLISLFAIVLIIFSIIIFLNKNISYFFLRFININDTFANQFIDTIHLVKDNRNLLLKIIVLSIFYYLFAFIMAIILLKALSRDISPYAAFTLPIIVLIGNIPITISGLGLREYITIICFGILGENLTIGFSFSILVFIMNTFIPGLIGSVFILKNAKHIEHVNHKDGQISGILSPFLEKIRLKKIVKWVNGATVLDCGCGSGEILKYLPFISRYTGIDSNKKAIEKAKMRKTSFETDYYVRMIGEDKLDVKIKYDNILMSAFIEHLDNPVDILIELKQLLTINGRIIITTPSPKTKHILDVGSRIKLFSREAFQEHKDHLSEEFLVNLLNESGLDLIYYEKFEFGFNQLVVAKRHD